MITDRLLVMSGSNTPGSAISGQAITGDAVSTDTIDLGTTENDFAFVLVAGSQ